MLVAVPALWWPVLPRHGARLLWLAEAALWLALLACAVRRPEVLRDSVAATAQNLAFGAGSWGGSLVVLAVLVLGALTVAATGRVPGSVHLRFPLTTFLPLAFLLAYLRDAAYRVGDGDSLNRMAIHPVPLAVLLVLVAVAGEERRPGGGLTGEPGRAAVHRDGIAGASDVTAPNVTGPNVAAPNVTGPNVAGPGARPAQPVAAASTAASTAARSPSSDQAPSR
jgi:hypothetical protein